MALDNLRSRLERAQECLNASFDRETTNKKLEQLLERFNSGEGERCEFEEYGRLDHRLKEHTRFKDRGDLIKEYLLADLSADEAESVKEEVETYLDEAKDFILLNKLTGKYDEQSAIITLQIGTNGMRDLGPFAQRLAQAYQTFARDRKLLVEEIEDEEREVSFEVKGNFAFGFFKGEHGVHRVIIEDYKGKRQTNYLTVIVEPLIENGQSTTLKEEDLKYTFSAASTPGGQNANTGNTGIRIRHLPTGITAISRRKSQNNNIKVAREVLASRVALHYKENKAKVGEERVNPTRGNHFRTYSLTKLKYIRDDRTGFQTGVDAFLKGKIDEFIYNFHGINFI